MSVQHLQLDPLKKPATNEQITAKRNKLELSPITTAYGVYDADRDSLTRINNTLAGFASLPLPNNTIEWTRFDNSTYELTQAELTEVRDAIVLRGLVLHVRAREIKQVGCTVGELEDLATWFPPT